MAKGHYKSRAIAAPPRQIERIVVQKEVVPPKPAPVEQPQAVVQEKTVKQDLPAQAEKASASRVTISKADMHKLVQSARVELNNSN